MVANNWLEVVDELYQGSWISYRRTNAFRKRLQRMLREEGSDTFTAEKLAPFPRTPARTAVRRRRQKPGAAEHPSEYCLH